MRLLARNSPYFFQLAPSPPVQPLQNYLEYILKKIVADLDVPKEETVSAFLLSDEKINDDRKLVLF